MPAASLVGARNGTWDGPHPDLRAALTTPHHTSHMPHTALPSLAVAAVMASMQPPCRQRGARRPAWGEPGRRAARATPRRRPARGLPPTLLTKHHRRTTPWGLAFRRHPPRSPPLRREEQPAQGESRGGAAGGNHQRLHRPGPRGGRSPFRLPAVRPPRATTQLSQTCTRAAGCDCVCPTQQAVCGWVDALVDATQRRASNREERTHVPPPPRAIPAQLATQAASPCCGR